MECSGGSPQRKVGGDVKGCSYTVEPQVKAIDTICLLFRQEALDGGHLEKVLMDMWLHGPEQALANLTKRLGCKR